MVERVENYKARLANASPAWFGNWVERSQGCHNGDLTSLGLSDGFKNERVLVYVELARCSPLKQSSRVRHRCRCR